MEGVFFVFNEEGISKNGSMNDSPSKVSGDFNHFLFSLLPGEMIQFDLRIYIYFFFFQTPGVGKYHRLERRVDHFSCFEKCRSMIFVS